MFWEKFAQVCAKKGVEPASVARRIYVPQENIEAWRSGATPNLKNLQRLAEVLEVSVADLLGDDIADLSGEGPFWNGFLICCRTKGTDPYALAEKIGLSLDAVDLWRQGGTPGTMALVRIAGELDVSISELFYYGDTEGDERVHRGVAMRYELEKLAEQLSLENVAKVIEFAEFMLYKQSVDPGLPKDDEDGKDV